MKTKQGTIYLTINGNPHVVEEGLQISYPDSAEVVEYDSIEAMIQEVGYDFREQGE